MDTSRLHAERAEARLYLGRPLPTAPATHRACLGDLNLRNPLFRVLTRPPSGFRMRIA
ncbi:hypothetical protein [Streptomyces sp. NWU339]|uniref:hypothetical protein n=1 Tax=Streptomyces sp. NWU339 TaxID=2185284 RepID=UPI0015E7FC49